MAKVAKPAILSGLDKGSRVGFTYTGKKGELKVRGEIAGFTGSAEEGITGVNIYTDDDGPRNFRVEGMKPWRGTTIAEPTFTQSVFGPGPAATERQVQYALSLCNPFRGGSGNFYRPTEAEFRAMGRSEISAWIDAAKEELD